MEFEKIISKSFVTIREMLRDRALDISSLNRISPEDVIALASSKDVFFVDIDSCKYRVLYNMNDSFKFVDIKKIVSDTPDDFLLMVVTKDTPGRVGRKSVEDVKRSTQFFTVFELEINPTRHVLVPEHIPIRDEESISKVLAYYNPKSRFHLPLILVSDPIARYYALEHGQLVKIIQKSPSNGLSVFYRCCM